MKCDEVQAQLSEYLETQLGRVAFRAIESHLALCAHCAETFADLAQCRSLIAALPQVDPPVGFTTRVMAHVREAAVKPPWWQRLLLPAPLRLPISATAIVIISVLSVYLVQREPGEKSVISSGEAQRLAATQESQAKLEFPSERKGETSPDALIPPSERTEKSPQSASKANSLGQPAASAEADSAPANFVRQEREWRSRPSGRDRQTRG